MSSTEDKSTEGSTHKLKILMVKTSKDSKKHTKYTLFPIIQTTNPSLCIYDINDCNEKTKK